MGVANRAPSKPGLFDAFEVGLPAVWASRLPIAGPWRPAVSGAGGRFSSADAGVKGTESAASTGDGGAPGAGDGQPTSPDSWQADFKRIEEAWLAGRTVGDAHEAVNFLHLLTDLHF